MLDSKPTPLSEDSAAPAQDGEDRSPTPNERFDELATLLSENDPSSQADPKDQGDQGGEPSQGEDPQKEGAKLDTLDAVAKKLGVDVSALYEIAIPQPGSGEDRVTLGEAVDMAKDRGQFELDRLDFDETKRTREADLMRAQQELNGIISLLPKNAVSREMVDAVAQKLATTRTKEHGLTLAAIPEWSDEQVEASERSAIGEHLAPYGFAANYLDNVQDHKTIKYIRDNWLRQQGMEKALAAMKRRRAEGHGKAGGPGKPPKKPGQVRSGGGPRNRSEQVSAVAELLRT